MTDTRKVSEMLTNIDHVRRYAAEMLRVASGDPDDEVLLLRKALKDISEVGIPSTEWRTIDSAPKDGTFVFLFGIVAGELSGPHNEPEMVVGYWDKYTGDYPGFEWVVDGGDHYASWVKPTHWQPLPEPPK